jgi:hypothetical protein
MYACMHAYKYVGGIFVEEAPKKKLKIAAKKKKVIK